MFQNLFGMYLTVAHAYIVGPPNGNSEHLLEQISETTSDQLLWPFHDFHGYTYR